MGIESLSLAEVEQNQVIKVKTGQDPKAYDYLFIVDEAGLTPPCTMDEQQPDGTIERDIKVELTGSGFPGGETDDNSPQFQPGKLVVGAFMRLKFYHGELRGKCDLQTPITSIEIVE